ncbi:MAG: hypothetical protein GXP40_05255, partial [Chloroflexi bacterium]|nr:hypothetical protein [Chloroflexota bacterium]
MQLTLLLSTRVAARIRTSAKIAVLVGLVFLLTVPRQMAYADGGDRTDPGSQPVIVVTEETDNPDPTTSEENAITEESAGITGETSDEAKDESADVVVMEESDNTEPEKPADTDTAEESIGDNTQASGEVQGESNGGDATEDEAAIADISEKSTEAEGEAPVETTAASEPDDQLENTDEIASEDNATDAQLDDTAAEDESLVEASQREELNSGEDTLGAGESEVEAPVMGDPEQDSSEVSEAEDTLLDPDMLEPLVDTSGDDAVLESISPSVPDPYFSVDGTTYRFLPTGGDCGTSPNCTVTETPIQAAIEAARDRAIDGNTIYIEGGIFNEAITIDSFMYALTLTGGVPDVFGSPTGPTTLAGPVMISNTAQTITLNNFIFGTDAVISVSDAPSVVINGTDASDKIQVSFSGSEAVGVTVNSHGGDDSLEVSFDSETPTGRLDYDGGDGFDALAVAGGDFDAVSYAAIDASSGSIALDDVRIEYRNIEPIQDNTDTVNRVIGMSNFSDLDATLTESGGLLTLSGSTFENITFAKPTGSLTIQGLLLSDKISIVGDITLNGVDLSIEAETIVVDPGVTVATNGGDISFSGEQITISNNAKLLAGTGAVTLTAQDNFTRQLLTFSLLDPNYNNAAIEITGATITGGDIKILADAKDTNVYDNAGAYTDKMIATLFALLDQIPGLGISAITGVTGQVVVHYSTAEVTISDTDIDGSGNVTIASKAITNASLQTVAINGVAAGGKFTLAVSYGQAYSTAKTTLNGSTTITANGAVNVTSNAKTSAFVKVRTSVNALVGAGPRNVTFAIAVANTQETSHVTVSDGVSITSNNEGVNIDAAGDVMNFAWAQPVTSDGMLAVAFALDFDTADIKTTINGRIDAAGGAGNTFSASNGGDVDYDADTIRIPGHGFSDGQLVYYSPGQVWGGLGMVDAPEIGGLCSASDCGPYYVQVIDADTIRLALAPTIDLGYTPLDPNVHPTHTLGKLAQKDFDSSDVNAGTGVITFPAAHGFQTGDIVIYNGTYSNPDALGVEQNKGIVGLEQGAAYQVVRVNDTAIQLKDDNGSILTFSDPGVGNHAFLYQSGAQAFMPETAVDDDVNTITFSSPHGFQTGDAVLYYTDPSVTTQQTRPPAVFEAGLSVVNSTTLTLPGYQQAMVAAGDQATLKVDNVDVPATVASVSYDANTDTTTVTLNGTVLTGGVLSRAVFASAAPIQIPDAPVDGLSDGGVYYVVKVNDSTIRLATSRSAEPIDLTPAVPLDLTGQGDDHSLRTSDCTGGICIQAGLNAVNAINTDSQITGAKPSVAMFVVSGLQGGFFTQTDKLLAGLLMVAKKVFALQPANSPTKASTDFGVAGAVSVNYFKHDVAVQIGATAELTSTNDINVSATINQGAQVAANAGASKPVDSSSLVSAAVSVGFGYFQNTATATVEGGAKLDAGGSLLVKSDVSYGFLIGNPLSSINPLDYLRSTGPAGYSYFNDGTLGFGSNLFNTFVMSAASGSKVGGGGSIAVLLYFNTSEARIKNGALINQNTAARFRTGEQAVNVDAVLTMNLINVVGVGGLGFNFVGLVKSGKAIKQALAKKGSLLSGVKELVNPFGAEGDKGGIGASFFVQVMDNTTEAVIEGGVQIYAGAGGSGVSVTAGTDIFDFSFVQAGGSASSFAVAGAFSIMVVDNTTKAHIDSGAALHSAGAITVSATDELTQIGITGGVVAAENLGVGVSVSVNIISRDTQAYIGTAYGLAPGTAGTDIFAAGPVTVSATSDGALWTAAVAGAGTSQAPPEQEVVDNERIKTAPSKAQKTLGETGNSSQNLKIGVGIAGDVAINVLLDDTYAYINDTGTVHTDDALTLSSSNDTAIWSLAGGVAISLRGDKTSVGIAGSISANAVTGNTKAFVSGAVITANSLSILAKRSGGIRSLTAAGSGAPLKNGISVAGSISVNLILVDTEAYLLGVTATLADSSSIKAQDESQIWAIGGAVAFGGKAGVGVGIAVNVMGVDFDSNLTRAYIEDSTVTVNAGTLEVSALNENSSIDPRIIAVTGSLGIGSGPQSVSGAGTISVNILSYDTVSYIKNSTITDVNTLLQAHDTSGIIAISGAVGVSQQTSIGAAISFNEIGNYVLAYLDQATLTSSGTLNIEAISESMIVAVTVGVAASLSGGVAVAGSLSINIIHNVVQAIITNASQVTTTGAISLLAKDLSLLGSFAGSVGGSGGSTGVGAAVSYNLITNIIAAFIFSSKVSSGSTLTISSLSSPIMVALALGGGGGQNVGFGGSLTVNSISNMVDAHISGTSGAPSDIDATGNISITAHESAVMYVIAGAGAGSTGSTAFGASVAYNYVGGNFDPVNPNVVSFIDGVSDTGTKQPVVAGADSLTKSNVTAYISYTYLYTSGELTLTGAFDSPQPLPSLSNIDTGVASITMPVPFTAQITNLTIAGSGADTFAFGGAISINLIHSNVDVYISNTPAGGAVTANGKVSLLATDMSSIYSAAGSGAGAGTTATSASVAVNDIRNSVSAYIDNARVQSLTNTVELSSSEKATIINLSIGGAGAGTVSISGSVSFNLIHGTVDAHISNNADVDASGSISLSAQDTSLIIVVAGNGGGAGTVAGAIAFAFNDIANTVKAYIDTASVQSFNGDITLTASVVPPAFFPAWATSLVPGLNAQIYAFALSGTGSGTASGAISFALNWIRDVVEAKITNIGAGQSVTALNGTISLIASEESSINSLAAAATGSGGGSVGASLAYNYLGGDPLDPLLAGSNVIRSAIENSAGSITANQIDLDASITSTINNLTLGGAGAQYFALGGAVSINNITNAVDAHIANSGNVNATSQVNLTATDNSTIQSLAGGVSGAVYAAVGAAIATNWVHNTIQAYISNSTVTGSDIHINANSTSNIKTLTVGGSGAGAFALGGAVSLNDIANTIDAYIADNSTVTAVNQVLVTATESATIQSLAGGVAGAGGAGIGAALATNLVFDTVQAYIDESIVTAAVITIGAGLTSTIKTITAGGALAGAFSLGGSVSLNDISSTIKAYIGNLSTVNATTGIVSITASDTSTIESISGTVSLSWGAAIGAALSTNLIYNTLEAYISGSTVSGSQILTKAIFTAVIKALAVGGTGAQYFAAGGSVTLNEIASTIKAYFDIANVSTTGQLSLMATDHPTIESLAGNLAVAGGAAIGAALATNDIGNTVQAYIRNATVVASSILLSAGNAGFASTIKTLTVGGAGAALLAAGGSVSFNDIGSTIQAFIDSNAAVNASGQVSVTATNEATIEALAGGAAVAGGASVGAALATNSIGNTLEAYISGSAVGGDSVTVNANSNSTIEALALGGAGAAGFALGGSISKSTIGNTLNAYISNDADVQAITDIEVTADSTADVTSDAAAGTFASVGVGSSNADAELKNRVTAKIDGQGTVVVAGGNVTLSSNATNRVDAEAYSGGIGLVDLAWATTTVYVDDQTKAMVGEGAHITAADDLLIKARMNTTADSRAEVYTGGLGASAETNASIDLSPSTTVNVDANAHLEALNVTILAEVAKIDTDAYAASRADAAGADTDATVGNTTVSTAAVDIATGAELTGEDQVEIGARHGSLLTTSKARAETNGVGGDSDATADTSQTTNTNITTQSGSQITTRHLLVEAYVPYMPTFSAVAQKLGAVIDTGETSATRTLSLDRVIDFNSHVIMLGVENPKLVIAADGSEEDKVNVSYTADPTRIIVGDISNDTFSGTITFRVDTSIFDLLSSEQLAQYGNVSTTNRLQGHAIFEFRTTLGSVTLINKSIKDLVINDIRVLNENGQLNSLITIDVLDSAAFSYDSFDAPGETNITIQNIDDPLAPKNPSDIQLRGAIENGMGVTTISTDGGDIILPSAYAGVARVESKTLTLIASPGNIGESVSPIRTVVTVALNAQASGDIFISQISGDLLVGAVASTGGLADLRSGAAILESGADSEVDVSGQRLILTAAGGGIGTSGNYLEINAWGFSDGLNLFAQQDVFISDISDTAGYLSVASVVSQTGSITLNADGGDMNLDPGAMLRAASGAVTLQANDDFTLPVDAEIISQAPVSITGLGNGTNFDNGALIDLRGVITITTADTVTVTGGANNDRVNITRLPAGLTMNVNTAGGVDTIWMGDRLNRFDGTLNVVGGDNPSGDGNEDTLWLDDSANLMAATGTLTSSTVTGFGMGATVTFLEIEKLQIDLGLGSDTVNVQSTLDSIKTVLNGGAGNDVFNVSNATQTINDIAGLLEINGQGDNDTLNVNDSG